MLDCVETVKGLNINSSIPPTRCFILYPVKPAPTAPNNETTTVFVATEPRTVAKAPPKIPPKYGKLFYLSVKHIAQIANYIFNFFYCETHLPLFCLHQWEDHMALSFYFEKELNVSQNGDKIEM